MANTAAVKTLMSIFQKFGGIPAHDIQTVIDGIDEIRTYATEASLLADSTVPDGLMAYAADTFNIWMRRNGAWSQRLASGQLATVVSKSAAYTATAQDEVILVDATSAAVTITLPAAASHAGRKYQVKKIDSSANAVTVDPNASETVDGAATRAIVTQWGALSIVCNGTAWFILSQDTRAYATESALLADTVPDGTVAYAQDTFNLWFRRNGAWSQRTAAGQIVTVVSKTAAYTATAQDEIILVDATGGAVTITLPAAASHSGRRYSVKKIDSSANVVTVDGNASETVDGALTKLLSEQWEALTIVCNGTAWFALAREKLVPTVTKTAAYTATANDGLILCDATGGAFSVTLPAAATAIGRQYTIKKIDGVANTVTIDGAGAETIDGAATKPLADQWDSMTIICDGTAWFVVASVGI